MERSKSNGQRSNDTATDPPVFGFSQRVGSFKNNKKKKDSQDFTDARISASSKRNRFAQQHSAAEDPHLPPYKILESFNNLQNGSQNFTKSTTKSLGIGESFNNRGSGSQDFTKTRTESLGIGKSFNNHGPGPQVFRDARISASSERNDFPQQHSAAEDGHLPPCKILDSFNNHQNGSQNFTRTTIDSLGTRDSFNNGGSGLQDYMDAHIRCVHCTSGILKFCNDTGNWVSNLLPKLSTLLTGRPGIRHSFNCPTGSQNFKGASIIV
ncbi:uncharacterized protein LOC109813198 [Cajanus cajan]|uniref:uncharacterized protein LOC109813198 n=1 Tax=Cajanus cajan TaxID=3821 RepID=UPI00098D95FF|nr:uncharacterized protein LOC109813198 [Cajanus cajan]XP_020232930.1 uncharacterized protein LOC109813198 [Cajanus cajan]